MKIYSTGNRFTSDWFWMKIFCRNIQMSEGKFYFCIKRDKRFRRRDYLVGKYEREIDEAGWHKWKMKNRIKVRTRGRKGEEWKKKRRQKCIILFGISIFSVPPLKRLVIYRNYQKYEKTISSYSLFLTFKRKIRLFFHNLI